MAERPAQSLWGYQALVSLPTHDQDPLRELVRRALLALGIIAVNTLIVWLDRDSYRDNVNNDGVSLIDALYYATVTVTTTGYGDITPVSDHARLLNAMLVTPLRIAFLILLVGTTLEVLANEGRRAIVDTRWRKKMRNHTVVLGYGTMGRSALATLLRNGAEADRLVVVDASQAAVDEANHDGVAALVGDCTSRELLRRAEVPKAKHIVITVNRDDTAILATLTARQLNPHAHMVAAVRSADNVLAAAAVRRRRRHHELGRRGSPRRPVGGQPRPRRHDGGPAQLRRGPRHRPAPRRAGRGGQQHAGDLRRAGARRGPGRPPASLLRPERGHAQDR